jgi:peptide/nickel transport system ATP-binding protein
MTPGGNPPAGEPLVVADELVKWFTLRRGFADIFKRVPSKAIRAVAGFNLSIYPGESVGLAGESGSGKSVTAEMIARLQPPTSGRIRFRGLDVTGHVTTEVESDFRRTISMVSQDPYDSLNPRMRVGTILTEPLAIHRIGDSSERGERVEAMLERVRLVPASAYINKHPHELSGGERQRVAIGRALMLGPSLLIADEPTTMLDVSVRSGLLNLIRDIRASSSLAILFISHDFSTLSYVCDRLIIMYRGRVVETGPTMAVLSDQLHPYTQALCAAIPVPNPENKRSRVPRVFVESDEKSSAGCPFAPRCPLQEEICWVEMPPLLEHGRGQAVACHVVSRHLEMRPEGAAVAGIPNLGRGTLDFSEENLHRSSIGEKGWDE